jgi:peptide/nickel transport system substrate-binding protein
MATMIANITRMRPARFALSLLVVAAASCSDQTARTGGAEPGGTIVVAAPGSGSSPMFPPLAIDVVGRMVADNVYERLAEIGPDMNALGDRGFTPRLARSWQWAPDSMSIAFAIDPRAKWHDGRPVLASDVRYSLRLIKDPRTASHYLPQVENIDSVSVPDSLTAVVWFRRRTPEQFYDIAYQLWVLPEHHLKDVPPEKLGDAETITRSVGSGRFRLARLEPGVRVELLADTAHYRGRPKLDRVIISFVADGQTALTQLLSGQADLYDGVPPDALKRVDSSGTVRLFRYPGLQYVLLWMNERTPGRTAAPHPIFADRRVRHAVSMALDRQAMARNVFDTVGTVASGPFHRSVGDTTLILLPFDRARAAALLDSAGWRAGADGMRSKNGRPLQFNILVPTSSIPRMRYAVLIQEQLRSIGIRAEIQSMDFRAFQERLEAGNFDAVLAGFSTDPARSGAKQNWTTAQFPPSGANYGRYSNRVVDALLDTASTTFDKQRADRTYHRAFQTLVDDAPAVWLYEVLTLAGAHKRIRTENMRPDGWWSSLADWWIPANERIERDRIGLRPAQP